MNITGPYVESWIPKERETLIGKLGNLNLNQLQQLCRRIYLFGEIHNGVFSTNEESCLQLVLNTNDGVCACVCVMGRERWSKCT